MQGRHDDAIASFERAYETRSIWFIFLNTEPVFDRIRHEPRFQALVNRITW